MDMCMVMAMCMDMALAQGSKTTALTDCSARTICMQALNVNEPGIQKKLRSSRYYYKHMLALVLRGDTFMGQLLCGLKRSSATCSDQRSRPRKHARYGQVQ